MARDQTRNAQTRWAVELYPFSPKWPGTIETNPGQPVSIITADKDKASFALEIQQNITAGPPSPAAIDASSNLINGGLRGLNLSRGKSRVDAQCTFQIQGRIPLAAFPGSWVIITSIRTGADGSERKLIRFIGQIYDMQPEEIVVGSAAIITITTFHVREWSAALAMPVRYDLFAIVNSLPQDASVSAVSNILNVTGNKPNTPLSVDDMQLLATKTFNPFELAQLILQLIGAMNADDQIGTLQPTAGIKLPEVAVRMPSVPPTLLKRLGLNATSSDNPFNTGFSTTITGVQKGPINNDGTWDGIFDSVQDDYVSQLDKSPPDRPVVLGMTALMAQGKSAWALITEYCDPAINEFYTDMLYELRDDGVSIRARPVVVIRDKPFLMSKLKTQLSTKVQIDSWTLYDDLPRFRLDNTYITRFSRNNTFVNSPNYFRTNFIPTGTARDGVAPALAQTKGTERLDPEVRQYGGQEFFIQTNFMSQDVINGSQNKFDAFWFEKIKYINVAWHSQNYKMMDGTLAIKDDNFPIAIGTNIQFKWGVNNQWDLVGHVEEITIAFKIDDRGSYTTDTSVRLTRIVQALPDQSLDFVPPEAMGNLFFANQASAPSENGSTLLSLDLNSILPSLNPLANFGG